MDPKGGGLLIMGQQNYKVLVFNADFSKPHIMRNSSFALRLQRQQCAGAKDTA